MSALHPLSAESSAAQRMSALPFGRHLSASARSIGECLTLFGFDLDQCSKAFFSHSAKLFGLADERGSLLNAGVRLVDR